MNKETRKSKIEKIAGEVVGSLKTTQDIENKTQWNRAKSRGATGFAAEDANSANDYFHGRKVDDVGRSCKKDGADRIVDGIPIQTKYYDTARKTVDAAFDGTTGLYRYYENEEPMLLEVPKDQYAQALTQMRTKIEDGKVPGVSDPGKAEDIVKEGYVTYKQARNIAKAGNIDSLQFDVKMSMVSTASSFGISFIVNFAILKYKKIKTGDALKISFVEGVKTGGIALVVSVLSRQILRTSIGRGLAVFSTKMSKGTINAFYGSSLGKGVVHKMAMMICEKPVYGVVAKNVAIKFVRTNVIVNVAYVLVNTVPDFLKFMDGRLSWKELTVSIASSITGISAFVVGAKLGAKIPGPAPVKFVASMLAGTLGALATTDIISRLLKTEKEKSEYDVIQEAVKELCSDYLIVDEFEFDLCMHEIQRRDIIDDDLIAHIRARKTMDGQRVYVYNKFKACFSYIIEKRNKISIPGEQQFVDEIAEIDFSEDEINEILNNN